MKKTDDFNKLDLFIKENAPLAPKPAEGHEAAAADALSRQLKKRSSLVRNSWIVLAIAASAFLALRSKETPQVVPQRVAVQQIIDDIAEDYGQGDDTPAPAYENWELLAESVSTAAVSRQ
ncbi:hypothetical protein N9D31_01200 [Oligoflexaceae bacterium]|nr:hypothetical protein [Oligoflexaceae bacterium]